MERVRRVKDRAQEKAAVVAVAGARVMAVVAVAARAGTKDRAVAVVVAVARVPVGTGSPALGAGEVKAQGPAFAGPCAYF